MIVHETHARLDMEANRAARKYSRKEMLLRVLWMFLQPSFRLSFRTCFGWRCWLLRLLGARIGKHVRIYPSATIYYPWMLRIGDDTSIGEHAYIYNLGLVTIGSQAVISQRAHLCAGTHDHEDPLFRLQRPPITIGDQAWICADAFVGPGVKVGEGAVVGARAAVFKDVGPWSIVGGNPATQIGSRTLRKSP
jgi:putative colanic acid biosynthesis acetyltransferase WcaF